MELTITYLQFVHGCCPEKGCPVCEWWMPKNGSSPKSTAWNKKRVSQWLEEKGITVLPSTAKWDSPWWLIEGEKDELYEKLGQYRAQSESHRKTRMHWAIQAKKNRSK
jgi:hypothetical protein